ncbi:MAG: ABC transporter permease [Anaerolineae bacterium CFX3]|nr:ABC transporter permease [Anaerolineae bacterium]MCE7906429.1 ABC transporter permease [Anaerolineae bacterium CFX3]MCQ3947695.1 ABC transporter permease [Anaerolineae bacterium]RIK26584.1 MAG: ABC transporter permease [Anaerolineae bacterium]
MTTAPSTSTRKRALRLHIEPRLDEPPRWYPAAISVGAIVIALVLGGILITFAGGDAVRSYLHIAKASFGSLGVLSDTIVKATPILLTTLACSVAFRMKQWNIGAEGQFIMGAWGASAIVLAPVLPAETSPWIFIPVMILAGMVCGALWGLIPGYLKAKFRVNEIISTLMMNYIAIAWVNFWVFAVWTEGGFQMSPKFPQNAWLPRLLDYSQKIPLFSGLTTHFGLVLGIVAAVIIWFVIYRSRWGYEIRLIGDNPQAAQYAGINITRNTILVMMLSGALAGLGGMSEVTGVIHRLQTTPIAAGYGFTGIIVAWLSKLNPIAAIFVSILFGALLLAGREIQPSGVPKMIQGVILVCLIASDFLLRYRVSITREEA